MQVSCPNCRQQTADLVEIDSVEFIECSICGWFETQGDGSFCPCDPPQSPVDSEPDPSQVAEPEPDLSSPNIPPPDNPADLKSGAGSDAPSSPVPDKPDDRDQDDPDEVTITIDFED